MKQEKSKEGFKRPDHNDFKTSKELEDSKFSGIRHNSVLETAEIWILGTLEKSITLDMMNLNPHAIQDALSEVFMLDNILPDTPEAMVLGIMRDKQRAYNEALASMDVKLENKH